MKTKEELNALKEEVETLNRKLRELTEEELEQVTGGYGNITLTGGTVTATHSSGAAGIGVGQGGGGNTITITGGKIHA